MSASDGTEEKCPCGAGPRSAYCSACGHVPGLTVRRPIAVSRFSSDPAEREAAKMYPENDQLHPGPRFWNDRALTYRIDRMLDWLSKHPEYVARCGANGKPTA